MESSLNQILRFLKHRSVFGFFLYEFMRLGECNVIYVK
ncbi:hypothetical protein CHELA1G11_21462 [Hyphomicrobiales bacterium]|nr:hypothetical protein CHELA1G11_21462 [Hyphomicrobiales bacterium]CAH1694738.1 hypothetical protein CHELA1G2_21767 [Hyphomicrobiales bacterium]